MKFLDYQSAHSCGIVRKNKKTLFFAGAVIIPIAGFLFNINEAFKVNSFSVINVISSAINWID